MLLFLLDFVQPYLLMPSFFNCVDDHPWTLTLNRAVLMSPTASYVIIQLAEQRFGVIGADLVDTLVDLLGIEKELWQLLQQLIFLLTIFWLTVL